jgi:zinc transporter 9
MGVLVGTSLVVIIPEGIEAIYTSGSEAHLHTRRSLQLDTRSLDVRWPATGVHTFLRRDESLQRDAADVDAFTSNPGPVIPEDDVSPPLITSVNSDPPMVTPAPAKDENAAPHEEGHHNDPPTFYIGFSLILGFILMFLIDKLPRHASENLQPPPPTRHISLDNLSQGLHSTTISPGDEESESFLQSLTPSPKQTRSLATTTGLVIHAAADGIAMGASASSSNTKLGFIIFIAIMIHKAPAAFGLTSVLLKQGLSKRAARGHLIIFSLAAPFGALTTWLLVNILGGGQHMEGERGQWWTGMLLLFSAGTFLCVFSPPFPMFALS